MSQEQKPNWIEKWTFFWNIISWTVVIILLTFITANLTKNNEIETRLYQIKSDNYKKFLDEYYKDFNSANIKSTYEKKYEELIENNIQDAYNWNATKNDIFEVVSSKCYYQSPNVCVSTDYKYSIIGWNQDQAMRETLEESLNTFTLNTYSFALAMPNNAYKLAVDRMQNAIQLSKNNFNDCNWWSDAECGFNFWVISKKTENLGIWWKWVKVKIEFDFIKPEVIELLKTDLQTHYKK